MNNDFQNIFSIDNETAKRREEAGDGKSETYIPHYVTNLEEGEKYKVQVDEDIWELAGRSNSKNPRQDLGQIKNTEL